MNILTIFNRPNGLFFILYAEYFLIVLGVFLIDILIKLQVYVIDR